MQLRKNRRTNASNLSSPLYKGRFIIVYSPLIIIIPEWSNEKLNTHYSKERIISQSCGQTPIVLCLICVAERDHLPCKRTNRIRYHYSQKLYLLKNNPKGGHASVAPSRTCPRSPRESFEGYSYSLHNISYSNMSFRLGIGL